MTTLYDYSQDKFKEGDLNFLSGRRVTAPDYGPGFYEIKSIEDHVLKCIYVKNKGNKGKTGTTSLSFEYCTLVPEIKTEFDMQVARLDEEIKAVQERVSCLEELKLDKITEEDFTIWKLMKAIKEEKDDNKIRQALLDNLKL